MALKRLTLSGETTDCAIREGLERLGLDRTDTYIEILRREAQGLFGHKDALVSIIFDQEQSSQALKKQAMEEFKRKFRISWKDEWVYLLIPPSFYETVFLENDEQRVEFLKQILAEHGVTEPDEQALTDACANSEGSYEPLKMKKLATEPVGEGGASIMLTVDEDEQAARAVIFHPENLTEEALLQYLAGKGVIKGVLIENIRRVLAQTVTAPFVIARGKTAVDDLPGPIEKFFQEDEHKQFAKLMEQLTIDTRSVKQINIAERHQMLARIGEITVGEDGYTVTGKRLLRKILSPTNIGITAGPNIYFSDNKREIYAKEPGHILWKPESQYLDVEAVYIVEGDVDFSEGNIVGFVGKVIVKGDVKPQFSIVAERDVEIQGSVEDATIKSTHGNVFVAGSVIHRTGGMIQAANTVHCNIANNATIKAQKIIIEKEAMNCTLIAEDDISAVGSPGAIIGGTACATYMIRANIIGSDRGAQTKVQVGDVLELKSKLRKIQQKTTRQESELKESEQVLKILTRRQRESGLTDSQEEQLKRAAEMVPSLQESLHYAKEDEEKILEEIKKRKNGRLEILKTLFPQVDVHIYEAVWIPRTAEQYTGLRCTQGAVKRYSL